MSKTLIHTALLCEAQSLIDSYGLKKETSIQNNHFKLFSNDEIIVIVSGMGKKNTIHALETAFNHFEIKRAINLGIAGCSDSSIKIGTLFCTNRLIAGVNFGSLTTVDEPLECDEELETLLVDMEAKYFLEVSQKYIKDILVLKVVSDYLETEIPKKSFVIELMQQNLSSYKRVL